MHSRSIARSSWSTCAPRPHWRAPRLPSNIRLGARFREVVRLLQNEQSRGWVAYVSSSSGTIRPIRRDSMSKFKVSSLVVAASFAVLCCVAFAQKQPKVKFTASQANEIALKKYPGKVQGKTPLEKEEGKWQYGVMVRSGKTL